MGSGITLTNIEIKYVIKVISSLQNRELLLKGTIGRKRITKFSSSINENWFTINAECTYTIS